MRSSVSGSFSLCFWRNLSLVKGAAEVTSQHEIPQEAMRQAQEGAARCCSEQVASALGTGDTQAQLGCPRSQEAFPAPELFSSSRTRGGPANRK